MVAFAHVCLCRCPRGVVVVVCLFGFIDFVVSPCGLEGPVRLVFLGSPEFVVPSLRALHAAGHEVALVVTRPDKPQGRSGAPMPTPVKEAARALGLRVAQPRSVNSPRSLRDMRGAGARLGIVVAYGQILSPTALAATELGFLNLHASLLPDYRGAAPINWALIRGEKVTGVSVVRMVPELDAGPVLAQRHVAIGEDENAGTLEAHLSAVGAEALADVVNRLAAGEELPGLPQPAEGKCFAPKLTKEDGRVDWTLSADEIRNRVRGLTPWPGAYCDLAAGGRARRVVLLRTAACNELAATGAREPGTVLRGDAEGIVVQTGAGALRIAELKPAGGRAMSAAAFVNGYRVKPGDRFM